MNIGIVTYALRIGGVETFIRLLAKNFSARGHHVDIIETTERGEWSDTFRSEGMSVLQVFPKPYRSRIEHCKRLAARLRIYDAVLLNNVPAAQAGLGLLSTNTVVIPVLHQEIFPEMFHTALGNARNWDAVSCVSPAIREKAVSYEIRTDRIRYIPNGVHVPTRMPRHESKSSVKKKLHVIFIGSITHAQKGAMYLPGIIEKILVRRKDIHFSIIGDGADLPLLRRHCARYIDAEIVKLYGSLVPQEAQRLLNTADVLLFPSHFEGMSLVLLEAMAAGVVPVASLLKNCTDAIVTDKKDGILVPVGEIERFASAVIHLARDKKLLRTLSRAAWSTVKSRFSSEDTSRRYLELIDECRGEGIQQRTGRIDRSLLGDMASIPIALVRPVRKIFRMFSFGPT